MKKILLFSFVFFSVSLGAYPLEERDLCRNGMFAPEQVDRILTSDNTLKDSYLRYGSIPEGYTSDDVYENSLMLRNPSVALCRIKGCEDILFLIEKVLRQSDLADSDFKAINEERMKLLLDTLISRKIFLGENSIRAIHKKYPSRTIFLGLRVFPACPKDIAEKYTDDFAELAQYSRHSEIIDEVLERKGGSWYFALENTNLRELHLLCIYEKINQECLREGKTFANYMSLRLLCGHPSLTENLAREILRMHPSATVRKELISNKNLSVAFRVSLIKTCPESFFYDAELLSNNYALFSEYTLAPCNYDELLQTEVGAFFVAGASDTPESIIRDMKKWQSTWYALLQNKSVSKNYLLEHGVFCLHTIKKIYDARAFDVSTPENMNDVVADLYFEEMKNTLMLFPNKSWTLQDRLFESFKGDSDLISLLLHSPSISPKVTDFFVQSFFDR